MKKEELIALGVSEEVAKQIMSINGTDIEAAKAKADRTQEIENLKAENKTKDELIANTNSEMEKFKTMDIEGIKNKVTELEGKNKEYETQLSTSKETYEKQLADQNKDFAIKELMSGQKFSNDFVKNAAIEDFKKQELKLVDGKFLGADDYFKNLAEKNPGVFVTEEAPVEGTPPPQFTTGNTNGQTKQDANAFNFGWNPPTK